MGEAALQMKVSDQKAIPIRVHVWGINFHRIEGL
jgi:hypothetical protein